MKLKNYLKEDIDKFFIRLGSMSGKKQKHRGSKQAPARKGVWMLPIQAIDDLAFLGGYRKKNPRLGVKEKDYEKEYGMSYDEFCNLPYEEMDKLDRIVMNRKIKKSYKKITLKNKEYVWTHMGKGPPDMDFGDMWPWYKVSVNEYWKLLKKTFGKELKQGYSFDGEWAEVFWETT